MFWVIDLAESALENGRKILAKSLDDLVKRGRLDADGRALIDGRVRWTTSIADAARAGLVIEAIVEKLDVKHALFASLADIVPADTVLASNTSSLSIAAIAEGQCDPRRIIGLHFFNPVPAMKLVEVIAGPDTDPAIIATAVGLMEGWGKLPVVVRDVPGFIVNRVARPYYAEGFAALGEGIAPATIDRALTAAGGFRMGPLALADLIGQDINYAVACSVYDAYEGRTRFQPQPSQQALAEGGKLGRKTGSGVYDYAAGQPEAELAPAAAAPADIAVAADPGPLAPLVAALTTTVDPALAPATISADGIVIALGDGRLLADREGVDVLIDHARDFATATTLVLTARDARSATVAAGLVQAGSRQVLLFPDRPGQIVLRTLAQLANAAADAVEDEVASGADIDTALRFGANHPEGPLAWARTAGHDVVATALRNIAQATGPLYTPSTYFDRA